MWFPKRLTMAPFVGGVSRISDAPNRIFLTFDDGPDPESTPLLLDLLAEFDIRATMFCLGSKAQKQPALMQAIRDAGHRLGNHGYHHLNGWRTRSKAYIENVSLGFNAVDSRLYRPPYGRLTLRQAATIKQNHTLVFWSRMPGDFAVPSSARLLKNLTGLKSGDIIVLHDQPESVAHLADILPQWRADIRAQGLTFALIPQHHD